MKYTVIADNSEKKGWRFIKSDYCNGMVIQSMDTADYTLEGFEDRFLIERKGSAGEFYQNLCTKDSARFERELERMRDIPHGYIVCEFLLNDIAKFPWSTNLPIAVKRKIGDKADFFMRRYLEVQTEYRIPIIFAGAHGKQVAISLFKRIYSIYET